MPTPALPVILDTDLAMGVPGSDIDDGFALALALADPGLDLVAVTCVGGNADVESAVLLAKELLELLDRRHVPVHRGAAAPLCHPELRPGAPEQIRAAFGRHEADPGPAAARIAELVAERPGEITIVAIGPLTNLAAAISLNPDLPTQVREVVIMGGVYFGHTHELRRPGEFNFLIDPEAANAVLRSGAPIRLVGLDVTSRVRLTRAEAEAMAAEGRGFQRFAGRYTTAWIDHLAERHPGALGAGESCALHDPLAVAVVTRPDLVDWVPAHVTVLDGASVGRGAAITDLLGAPDPPSPNARVARAVDTEGFRDHFFSTIRALDAKD